MVVNNWFVDLPNRNTTSSSPDLGVTSDITGWLNTSDLYFDLGEIALKFDRVMRVHIPEISTSLFRE